MSKNYFNINDNYAKNCDKITRKHIIKATRKALASPSKVSQFLKDKKRQNKWLKKHGSGASTTVINYTPVKSKLIIA